MFHPLRNVYIPVYIGGNMNYSTLYCPKCGAYGCFTDQIGIWECLLCELTWMVSRADEVISGFTEEEMGEEE